MVEGLKNGVLHSETEPGLRPIDEIVRPHIERSVSDIDYLNLVVNFCTGLQFDQEVERYSRSDIHKRPITYVKSSKSESMVSAKKPPTGYITGLKKAATEVWAEYHKCRAKYGQESDEIEATLLNDITDMAKHKMNPTELSRRVAQSENKKS